MRFFFFYLTLFYSNTIYIQQCYFIKSFTNICPHQNFIKKIYEKITFFFYCFFNFLLIGVFYKFGFSLLIPSNRLQILEYLPKKRKERPLQAQTQTPWTKHQKKLHPKAKNASETNNLPILKPTNFIIKFYHQVCIYTFSFCSCCCSNYTC